MERTAAKTLAVYERTLGHIRGVENDPTDG